MLRDIVKSIGVAKVAQECGVNHRAVDYWCRVNRLPARKFDRPKKAHYERCIAKLAGMPVKDLRRKLKGGA